jgi:hypothetical protein
MSPFLQSLLVALVVLACSWRVLAGFAPKTAWRVQARLSFLLEVGERPAWLKSLGRRLRPRERIEGRGCGSGCSSCGGCAARPAG